MEVSESLAFLTPVADGLFAFFSASPVVRSIQVLLGALASGLVFLVFYTTRDVILRSTSLIFQLCAILIVATLPIIGFFLYILFRPERTLRQRELQNTLEELVGILKKQRVQLHGAPAIGKMVRPLQPALREKVEIAKKKRNEKTNNEQTKNETPSTNVSPIVS